MPLRYIRSKVTADGLLSVAIATASATSNLANLSSFPPASVAAAILLQIFQTIQDVQTNKSDCYRLANRCLSLLLEIREQMGNKWEDSPPSLLKALAKFEKVLESIYEFFKAEAESNWRSRLLRKGVIQGALANYNLALDDAARSFQIATLINIHYSVGDKAQHSVTLPVPKHVAVSLPTRAVSSALETRSDNLSDVETLTESPARQTLHKEQTFLEEKNADFDHKTNTAEEEQSEPQLETELTDLEIEILDHHGFRRYHQSEVKIKGKSRVKEGWWADSMDAQVNGNRALVKPYEGRRDASYKKWIRDVKILQNVFHPNLPQMIGYSHEENPTPFILLANVQTRLPQALVLDLMKRGSIADCVNVVMRFYREALEAAFYLQRQLSLSESKIQDYVENSNYRIDAENTLVMGLPPPEIDRVQSWRNYGLPHSVRDIFIKLLPYRSFVDEPYDTRVTESPIEMQRKNSHLTLILRALLPTSSDTTIALDRMHRLLGNEDEEQSAPPLTSRQIRLVALDAGLHNVTWRKSVMPAYKYAVGDVGYLEDSQDPRSITVLCNVLRGGLLDTDIGESAWGTQFNFFARLPNNQELQPFPVLGDRYGWAIVVPEGTKQNVHIRHEEFVSSTGTAWRYLLEHGKVLAEKHGKRPEDLLLVTRVGVEQRFRAESFGNPFHNHHAFHQQPPGMFGGHFAHGPGMHAVHMHHHPHLAHGFGQHAMPSIPTVAYLFTSKRKDCEPIWSDSPVCGPRSTLQSSARFSYIWDEDIGYLNYVQLYAEDFAD